LTSTSRRGLFAVALAAGLAWPALARAQFGIGQPQPPGQAPAQPNPNQPETHAASGADDEDRLRTQDPTIPADPLAVPPEAKKKIGTDFDPDIEKGKAGLLDRTIIPPYYQEKSGEYRFRTVFPFWFERTQPKDRASLFGLFYYNRRSPDVDADVLFPFFWKLRDEQTHTTVVGPFMHREREASPGKPARHDNWLPPLFFEGASDDGSSYMHIPPLLTFTQHTKRGGFNMVGPLFCKWKGGPACDTRTADSIDMGVAPFYFYGKNERTEYELIPPLLHYYRYSESGDRSFNLWGPLLWEHTPESDVFNVMPFYWHSWGKNEDHRTLFPFFHYGYKGNSSLLVTPLFLSSKGEKGESTFVTWGYARYRGRTELDMITPLYWQYRDPDIGLDRKLLFPFFYRNTSPRDDDLAILPFYGHFKRKGIRDSYWVTPFFNYNKDVSGWSTNLYPFFFMGRSDQSTHLVVAPFVWDFASPRSRTTVILPAYFRIADDAGVSQLALNTYYHEKPVRGGKEWEFHFFPVFSYGESPQGHWWNVLYGLAGYTREGTMTKMRALYVPIKLSE
jgi:hypothetical protein